MTLDAVLRQDRQNLVSEIDLRLSRESFLLVGHRLRTSKTSRDREVEHENTANER